jgi:hypothetical protein
LAPKQWLCDSGVVFWIGAANHIGSTLIIIYLKYENLSERADGGSRVELPELRAGNISFKCKANTI